MATEFTSQTTGTIDGSDANPTTGLTPVFTLNSGENIRDVDAGIILQDSNEASLGNKVWYDTNNNGLQDSGEVGVAGVTVQLYTSAGVLSATTQTDVFGNYIFNGLSAGDYYIQIDATTLPSGYSYVSANTGSDDNVDSDIDGTNGANTSATTSLVAGERDMSWDIGIYNGTAGNASLGDYVFYDNNKNGIQEAGELGVGGVTVTLYDDLGNVLAITMTNSNGYYLFPNLDADDYVVGFTNLPQGYIFSPQDIGGTESLDSDVNVSSGLTNVISLLSAQNNIDVDAGIHPGEIPSGTASIGDYVFYDINNNGIQEAGELGVPEVTVNLYESDGTTLITSTSTDGMGHYIFTGLEAGDYIVEFDILNFPSGYSLSPQDAGTDETIDSDANVISGQTSIIILGIGEDNLDVDAGIYNAAALGSIGDFVWFDTNNNGLQDVGEAGVIGIMVTLYNDSGDAIASTTTDINGNYLFEGLADGDYTIGFSNLPTGFSFTTSDTGGDDDIDSDADASTGMTGTITVSGANDIDNVDAGLTGNVAILGDTVWFDTDGDGLQEAGENGVPGVTVTLFDGLGDAVSSAITDANGNYLFTNLTAGDYTLSFTTIPSGAVFTLQDATADNMDSDVNPLTGQTATITLNAGDINLNVDAGITSRTLGSLGNYVWYDDVNTNGIQDASEMGVSGVLVTLYNDDDDLMGVALTDADGYYLFDQLLADNYYVEFSNLPTDYVLTYQDNDTEPTDSDADRELSMTTSYKVNGNHERNVDAGIAKLQVQGYTWFDADEDGLRDETELLLDGISVRIYHSDGTFEALARTYNGGSYEFFNLPDGEYYIVFDQSTTSNYDPSLLISGTHRDVVGNTDITDELDSDMKAETYTTANFTLMLGDVKRNIDGGFATSVLPVELMYFEGSGEGCETIIEWATASEENNDYFILEHSANGLDYTAIEIIQGNGNSVEMIEYRYIHEHLTQAVNYYRLKQVDFDGNYEYFDPIVVETDCNIEMGTNDYLLYPNPTTGLTHIVKHKPMESEIKIMIIDISGRVLDTQIIQATSRIDIDLSKYESGMYMILLEHENDSEVFRVIKENSN